MKNLFPLLILILVMGCDKIDDPLKDSGITFKGCECDVDASDPFITERNVLIEEFTGHTCNNCPLAATKIKELEAANPDRIYAIAIHASNFAVPNPPDYPNDFRVQEGLDIHAWANPIGVPSGLISRTDYNTSDFSKLYFTWETEVNNILSTGNAEIGILPEVSINQDTICLKAGFKALGDLTGRNLKWAAFLTESKIIAPQKMPDNSKNTTYEHSHMLRAAFNSNFGTAIPGFTGATNEVACISKSLILDPDWVAANCEVVVYVYEEGTDTREVLQAVSAHL